MSAILLILATVDASVSRDRTRTSNDKRNKSPPESRGKWTEVRPVKPENLKAEPEPV